MLAPKGECYFQVYRILEYPFYYLLGYYFEKSGVRAKLFNIPKVKKGYFASILFVVSIILIIGNTFLHINSNFICNCYAMIQAIVGTLFVFIVSSLTVNILVGKKIFKILFDNNFSVYLYHEPLQFALLSIFAVTGALQYFNNELGYVLLIVVRFALSIAASVFIGRIVGIAKNLITEELHPTTN